jgi:ParB family chromosome partitioning protein
MSTDTQKNQEPRKALGRGLSALIGSTASSDKLTHLPTQQVAQTAQLPKDPDLSAPVPKNINLLEVELSKIVANPEQPRKVFNQAKLEELAISLKERGLVQPIVLKKVSGGNYQIIAGERRYRASKLAGFDKIPAIVRNEQFGEEENELASLVENIQREELSPIELAQAYDRMLRLHGFTQESLAQKVGLSRVAVANTLRLLRLPNQVREMVASRVMSEGHARALLQLDDAASILSLANEIIQSGLTVREVESRVRLAAQKMLMTSSNKTHSNHGGESRGERGTTQSDELIALEDELKRLFGAKVSIRGNEARGSIEVYFSGKDSLNRIVHQLRSLQG